MNLVNKKSCLGSHGPAVHSGAGAASQPGAGWNEGGCQRQRVHRQGGISHGWTAGIKDRVLDRLPSGNLT